jgi:hypothetical protein
VAEPKGDLGVGLVIREGAEGKRTLASDRAQFNGSWGTSNQRNRRQGKWRWVMSRMMWILSQLFKPQDRATFVDAVGGSSLEEDYKHVLDRHNEVEKKLKSISSKTYDVD